MTDDNNSRYRSSDPFANAPAPAGQGSSDPLAELARLIGKNDPFSELGRSSHAPASPSRDAYREPHFDPAPQPQHDDHRFDSHTAAPSGWDATAQPAPGYDPFASHAAQAPMAADARYEDHPYAAGGHGNLQPQPIIDTYQPETAAHHDALHNVHAGYDSENAPRVDDVPGFGPPPFHPAESGAAQPSEDQFYDDAPPRRRKGLVTVMAVLGLAVLGTAGAFGYRSFTSGGGSSLALPPIIRASTEPNKVAPPPAQANADASKISYDRFGDRGLNEKVVPREEQPVDQREIARSSSVPRTVLPGAPTPNAQASNNPPSANPPSALGEPKRIRTVPIRPDQADASASVAAASSVVPKQQVASFPPPLAATPQPVQQPMQPRQAAVAPPPVETAPAPQPERAAPAPRSQRAQPAPSGNAPLSLAPDANASSLPPPTAQAAPRPAAPPMRVASAPSNGGTGGYLVQVSSQRSESDAQNAFRSVQGKYSSVLGGQPSVIRRVELGEKGTYYRAMVGPFSTRDQAVQLCSSLKSAGGDCVVQSN